MAQRKFLGYQGIKPITKTVSKKKFIAFDCETYVKDENKFKIGSVVGKNFVKVFWDKDEMGKFLLSKKFKSYIRFATNLGFDLSCIYQPYKDNWELLISNGGLIFGKHKEKNNPATFWDTLNLTYNMSVKKMGEILGTPKGAIDFNNCSDEELEKYNIKDSLISYNFMEWFQDYINSLGGEMKVTLASTSLYLFKRKYLKNSYKKPFPVYNSLSRQSYFGGRTEVFQEGNIDHEFYVYDYNSLYPYSMKIEKIPNVNHLEYNEFGSIDDIYNKEGISKVKIKTPYNNIPILPIRHDGKLIFANGIINGVYCHNELRYALMNGYEIQEIGFNLVTDQIITEFQDYIDEIYNQRMIKKQANDKREKIDKILLNALYGKFGINPNKNWSGILKHYDHIKDPVGWYQYGNTMYFFNNDNFTPSYEIPLFSSYITARARIILHQGLTKCGKIYYCDTDSIFTPKTLINSNKIGGLKRELTVVEADIKIPKGYRLKIYDEKSGEYKWIYKFKGVPHCSSFTHPEGCQCTIEKFWKQNFSIQLKRFIKIKTGLKMNKLINSQYLITKNATLENNKRNFDHEGNSKPLEIFDNIIDIPQSI